MKIGPGSRKRPENLGVRKGKNEQIGFPKIPPIREEGLRRMNSSRNGGDGQ